MHGWRNGSSRLVKAGGWKCRVKPVVRLTRGSCCIQLESVTTIFHGFAAPQCKDRLHRTGFIFEGR